MVDRQANADAEVVMPVSDLHGRTVWSDGGQRIGTIREINTDEDGRIVSFDVRERWFFGSHHEVPASDMRLDGGDVIVPMSALRTMHTREARTRDAERRDTTRETVTSSAPSSAPVLLAGREGVRERFGGLDFMGSLFGGLVTIASLVLVSGVLSAIFGVEAANFDLSFGALEDLLDEALLVGAATLFIGCFLGGWCAGRSARYDGVANGVMSVVWTLLIIVGIGALVAWVGDEYDVFANTSVPTLTNDEFATWGVIGFLVALGLMLLGGALGGALGESFHRRADRAMLDVVPLGARTAGSAPDRADRVDTTTSETVVTQPVEHYQMDMSSEGDVDADAPRVVREPSPHDDDHGSPR